MRLGSSLIGALIGAAVGIAIQVGVESGLRTEATWMALIVGALTGLGARMMAGEFIKTPSYFRGALAALIGFVAIAGGSYAASAMIRKNSLDSIKAIPTLDTSSDQEPVAADGDEENTDDQGDNDQADSEATDDSAEEDSAAAEAEAAEDDASETKDNEPDSSSEGEDAGDTASAEEDGEAPAGDSDDDDTGSDFDSAENLPAALSAADGPSAPPNSEIPFSTTQAILMGLGTFLAYEFARGGGKGNPGT